MKIKLTIDGVGYEGEVTPTNGIEKNRFLEVLNFEGVFIESTKYRESDWNRLDGNFDDLHRRYVLTGNVYRKKPQ